MIISSLSWGNSSFLNKLFEVHFIARKELPYVHILSAMMSMVFTLIPTPSFPSSPWETWRCERTSSRAGPSADSADTSGGDLVPSDVLRQANGVVFDPQELESERARTSLSLKITQLVSELLVSLSWVCTMRARVYCFDKSAFDRLLLVLLGVKGQKCPSTISNLCFRFLKLVRKWSAVIFCAGP